MWCGGEEGCLACKRSRDRFPAPVKLEFALIFPRFFPHMNFVNNTSLEALFDVVGLPCKRTVSVSGQFFGHLFGWVNSGS